MDLQEDIAAKVEVIKVPQDAQDHKNELNRITKYIMDLQEKVKKECDAFSEDVKYWAEYKTGIKEFTPWLTTAEKSSNDGLAKPTNLEEALALSAQVHSVEGHGRPVDWQGGHPRQ